MLNRTLAPSLHQLHKIDLIHAREWSLSNGLPVFEVNGSEEEVCRLEIIWPTGARTAKHPTIAQACNALLNAGTSRYSSFELMERIDYYGAFYQHENQFDRSSVSIYTLNKYAAEVLDLFYQLITEPQFPESELNIYKQNSKQRLQINLEKNDFLARRAFNEQLFKGHPYGSITTIEDIDSLRREDLVQHFQLNYNLSHACLVLAGKITSETRAALEQSFGQYALTSQNSLNFGSLPSSSTENIYQEKEKALQSTIRIGRRTINKTHNDYFKLSVLTTLLGGYFGSRLMANLREDKGYTYGVGAGLMSLPECGIFYIATEVGAEVCSSALHEIYKEIENLRSIEVPEHELDLVKNYLRGSYISGIENIFSHADKFKSLHFYGLNYDYYDRFFKALDEIKPDDLLQMAKQYLQSDDLLEVVVGKK